MHKDIITVWNIRDLNEYFLSDEFCHRMAVVVGDLSHGNQRLVSAIQKTVAMGSPSPLSKLTSANYPDLPEQIHSLMGYAVDLTLILQAVFQVSLHDRAEGKTTQDRVSEIIYEFHLSEKKKLIHDAIVGAQHLVANDSVVEQIKSLIKENEMTDSDSQLDEMRPTIPLLLSILRFEQSANGPVVNKVILGTLHKVLDLPDYGTVVDEMVDPLNDVETLIDFILYALRNDSLSDSGIPDANRRAGRLMFKLINKTDVTLKFLSITDVEIHSHHGMGEFARVYKGEYRGQQVALKMLDQEISRKKDFCRQALAWRLLVHKSILPLVGIFGEAPQQFLVSPFMSNGTLTQWRKNKPSSVIPDVHRMMLEVARGLQYIHSEGIVHGDLCGENVLLDSDFHCRIAGFGMARHFDATVSPSALLSWLFYFPAPELLGNCDKCGEPDCNGCREDHETSKATTTKAIDVCAFGCLYYLIFFNTYPFQGKDEYQVLRLVARGARPDRLSDPIIEDDIWDIIQRSWLSKPSERPTIQQIVKSLVNAKRVGDARDLIRIRSESSPSEHLTKAQIIPPSAETYPGPPPAATSSLPVIPHSFSTTPSSSPASATATSLPGIFPSLFASLNESTTRGESTVNKLTLDLTCKLLDLPEYTIAASEVNTADVELLIDFLLHVCFVLFSSQLICVKFTPFSYFQTSVACPI
ncbi:kinase-like domain-containing protein [Amanita rubescens]|nr:kinase-like domain-containing protein [Amanita rubescens]